MDWWAIAVIVPIVAVILFIIWEIATYKEPPRHGTRHDPSRARWTSSAMQDDMQGGE